LSEIISIAIKFYRGCIFHNGRTTFARCRRKGDSTWDDLCEECYRKAVSSSIFLAYYEVEIL